MTIKSENNKGHGIFISLSWINSDFETNTIILVVVDYGDE